MYYRGCGKPRFFLSKVRRFGEWYYDWGKLCDWKDVGGTPHISQNPPPLDDEDLGLWHIASMLFGRDDLLKDYISRIDFDSMGDYEILLQKILLIQKTLAEIMERENGRNKV